MANNLPKTNRTNKPIHITRFNTTALEYNALKTKAARDAILVEKLKSDITSKIPGGLNPPWGCAQASFLFLNNAHNWGKNVYIGDHLLYNGYDGDDEYLIKTNEGTIKYIGTSGIPVCINEIYDPVTMPGGHGNNEVITGKEIRNGKDWNVMEVPPPWNRTNDQPGETYIPLNTDYFMIYYTYLYKSAEHDKNIANIPVVLFKIVNGEYIFQGTNPYVRLIMERESDPPIISITSPLEDSIYDDSYVQVQYNIQEKNFKSAWFSTDGKERQQLKS